MNISIYKNPATQYIRENIKEIIDLSILLPENIFKKKYNYFKIIPFEYLFDEELYNVIIEEFGVLNNVAILSLVPDSIIYDIQAYTINDFTTESVLNCLNDNFESSEYANNIMINYYTLIDRFV